MKRLWAWTAAALLAAGACDAPPRAAEEPPVHALHVRAGAAHAEILQHGYRADIDPGACHLTGPTLDLRLRLVGVGRADDLAAPQPGVLAARDARVVIDRGAWTEWYESRARGLEQGFVAHRRPHGAGALTVALAVEGLTPEPARGRVDLRDASGRVRMHYGELVAYDAEGRDLPAHFHLEGTTLQLRVDDADATYPVTIDPLFWVEHQSLVPLNLGSDDKLGADVALDGDTAVVVARDAKSVPGETWKQGAVHVYERQDGTWTETQKLIASTIETDGMQGAALEGDELVVVGYEAAFVYARSAGVWSEVQRIDTLQGNFEAVDLEGDTLVVGAYNSHLAGQTRGAVQVFAKSGGMWTEAQVLTPPDDVEGSATRFGAEVVLSGDTMAITGGAPQPHSVYLYVRSGGTWSFEQKLTPPGSEDFGDALALEGNTLFVSSWYPATPGAAVIFERQAGVWTQVDRLEGDDDGDEFGQGMSIDGDRIAIGARGDDNGPWFSPGAVFIAEREGGTWSIKERLTAGESGDYAYLGDKVALDGHTVLAGAPESDVHLPNAGAAYIWNLVGMPCGTTSDCGNGRCIDGVCCESDCDEACARCDVAGHEGECTALPAFELGSPSCFPFLCGGEKNCAIDCSSDEECADGAYCFRPPGVVIGECKAKGTSGDACFDDSHCEGECVAGACCDECARECAGCDQGICGPLPAGSPGPCAPFACDGESLDCPSACTSQAQCHEGTQCHVASGTCISDAICDGDHTMIRADGSTQDCAPYRCDDRLVCPISCNSTAECVEGFFCAPDGACVERGSGPILVTSCSASPGMRDPGAAPWWLLALLGSLPVARLKRCRARRPQRKP